MLIKLSLRNAKRTWRDYLVFFVTLLLIAAIMFSFNGLLFDPDIRRLQDDSAIMAVMLGIATFFILLVLTWLLQYMVRFMMSKRSREFATYLLLGMKRRQISKIFWGESLVLGIAAFLLGTGCGIFFRQFLFACFYALIGKSYQLNFCFNPAAFLMTVLCFFGCYLLSLAFHHKKFRGMNISGLLQADRENEQIREGNLIIGTTVFLAGFAGILSIILVLTFFSRSLEGGDIVFMMLLLILSIYLMYWGLASLFSLYLRKRGKRMYKGTNLFLIRQLSSKIRTMRFTFGTLTVLFTLALLGCSFALMLNRYQNTEINYKYPFLKEQNVEKLSKEETADIKRKTGALVCHKVGDVARLQTDSIIISGFINVAMSGVVDNYNLVISSVSNFVNIIFNSVISSFGNLIATESKEKQYSMFCIYRFFASWIYGFSAVGFYILLTPLIQLWLGDKWMLPGTVTAAILLDYYFKGERVVLSNFKTAAGVFEQDKYLPLVQGAVNLIISIVLVRKIGLVGVYIGTIVSGLLANFIRPVIIYRVCFERKTAGYFIDAVKYIAVIMLAAVCCIICRNIFL